MSTIIGFDFATKQEITVAIDNVPEVCEQGYYCWLDLDATQIPEVAALAERMNLNFHMLDFDQDEEILDFYEDCIVLTLKEGRFVEGRFRTMPVQVIIAKQMLITIDFSGASFLQRMRKSYHEDFINVAQTAGFLVFEIADHLVNVYQKTMHRFAEHNERLQLKMFGDVDASVFRDTADLISQLLNFREILLIAGEILDELVARRSPFLAETTKPHLHQKAMRLDGLCAEVLNERDALTSSLNLYLSMTGYRTNLIMQRLTAISFIFLPLSFLVGLYGMNFKVMPELEWQYGYLFFWCLVILVLAVLLIIGRRWRL